MSVQPSQKRRIKAAYADVQLQYVRNLLDRVSDRYDFELTTDRDADYVIFSSDGLDVLKYPGVRLFICGENVTPNFAICDYAMAFEQMNFGDRNLWTPLFKNRLYPHLLEPRPDPAAILTTKTGFCAYVMSNTTRSDDIRCRIFEELNRYKPVSSGGLWRNNVGGRVKNKIAFQKSHKFVIAFENCSYPGYLTEKFTDAAASDAVPIYWGDPGIGQWLNPAAFINCHDFESLDAVVARVREIDQDDALYMQMLSEPWFVDGREPECFKEETFRSFLCHLFDQEPVQAYRRNRGRWGMKTEKNLYDMYHRPHIQLFKNLRKIWRRIYHKVMPHRKPY